MTMPQWVLKYKEPKTEIRLIKGFYYKYAVEYKYNPSKKRTDKKTKDLLGRITEDKGFVPSHKYSLKERLSLIPRVDIKTFGFYHLFKSLLSDDIESLSNVFDKEIVETLLCVTMMRFGYQSPLKRIPYLHSHDYCSQDWMPKGLDDKRITAALRFVGENRNMLVEWMRSRVGGSEATSGNYVMMDSTHIPTLSENIHINAKGYNPHHHYDPQVRLMYIFSAQQKQPVYYRLINGNITDVKSMKNCVEEFGEQNVIFIADKGFYSKENTERMKENSLHYIIPLNRNNGLIDFKPLAEGNFKQKIKKYFTYQERIIWYYEYENEGHSIVTFLDERLRVEEEKDYLLRIQSHPENYSEEKYYKRMNSFGTLSILNYLPNKLTPQILYEVYKQRNEIEIMFDAYKNFLDADRTYMHDRYVLEGWLMANFIAMIAYYRLFVRIKETGLMSKYSPKDMIEMSKTIYMTKVNNNWRLSEITKKTTDLFKKINIDYLT